ncbi:hypothetical protein BH23ACT10_BH23ACT10_16270 [soil metagenome]
MDIHTHGRGGARRRDVRPWVTAAMAAVLLSACAGAADETGSAASPESAPAVSEPVAVDSEAGAAADADAIITGVDYAFDVGGVSAGDTVEFVNGSDVEAHEMVVMKVTDDTVTLEDIQTLLEEDPEGPPPEFLEEAGFAFAMPGETAEQTVTLDQGRYLLLCFIPQNAPPEMVAEMMQSESSEPPDLPSDVGPPHAVAGMIDLIEVE